MISFMICNKNKTLLLTNHSTFLLGKHENITNFYFSSCKKDYETSTNHIHFANFSNYINILIIIWFNISCK